MPKTITAQLTVLVAAAVVAGVLLTFAVLVSLMGNPRTRMDPQIKAASEAARIATIVREVKSSGSSAEFAAIVARAQSPGSGIATLPAEILSERPGTGLNADGFALRISDSLRSDWGIEPLRGETLPPWTNAIVVRVGNATLLAFQVSEYQTARAFLLLQAGVALSIILVAMLAVSAYAIRWVTRPLSDVAEAARSFGRSSDGDRVLKLDGPREIAQVAHALNDMRKRVRSLVDERTRMLAAISHDLRTPLTRLRLRAERGAGTADRQSTLNDVATIDAMLSETLAYLRDGRSAEIAVLVDLPCLLQTICDEFNDVGHDVQYRGPGRLAFTCRAQALTRAVTNVIENGVKHGSSVTLALTAQGPNDVQIEILDDGPGIHPDLLERAFEPFFKSDTARSSLRAVGFGLGLSIARDIVERDGGSITLHNGPCGGLKVRMVLFQRSEV